MRRFFGEAINPPAVLFLLVCVLSLIGASPAPPDIKITATISKNGKSTTLEAEFSLPSGIYVYKNSSGDEGPIGLNITFPKGVRPVGEASYSKSETIYDPVFKKLIPVLKNNFRLSQPIKISGKFGQMPLEANFQFCDGNICSLPVTKKFNAK